MNPILSLDFQSQFYSETELKKEKAAELAYDNLYKFANPTIKIEKKKIYKGTPDGIIIFKDGQWIIQEVKRDIGASPETLAMMLLQNMMTAGHFFYNLNPFRGRFNCKGFILDSMQFFAFIPMPELEKIIDSFEDLWLQYRSIVSPSEAFDKIPELAMWARRSVKLLNFKVYNHIDNYRLDLVLEPIFND
jgi:hypothetical protein